MVEGEPASFPMAEAPAKTREKPRRMRRYIAPVASTVLALSSCQGLSADVFFTQADQTSFPEDANTLPFEITEIFPGQTPISEDLSVVFPAQEPEAKADQITFSETERKPKVLWETNTGKGSEPNISVSSKNPRLVAVTYQNEVKGTCNLTGVRISKDKGRTFKTVRKEPFVGYCPDHHAEVAFGPNNRLWWADVVSEGGHRPAIRSSKDLGKTWGKMHIERRTPAWSVGGFPDITVDNNKESPNYGTVYMVYNYLENNRGPGLAIIASFDNGKSWQLKKVPAVGLRGYPYRWRINYRLQAFPDGSLGVSYYEADLKHWSKNDIFNEGGPSNIGRRGFAFAHLEYNRETKKFKIDTNKWAVSVSGHSLLSQFQTGLSVDPETGRVWMSVSDGVRVKLGHSGDKGKTWHWKSFKAKGKRTFKPSVAAQGKEVFLGFHTLDSSGIVRTVYKLSHNNGKDFTPTRKVTKSSWDYYNLPAFINNAGLRENAEFGSDGLVHYVYADARRGKNRVNIFSSVIRPRLKIYK